MKLQMSQKLNKNQYKLIEKINKPFIMKKIINFCGENYARIARSRNS